MKLSFKFLSADRIQRCGFARGSPPISILCRRCWPSAQEHQHSRPSTPPLSLAELETAALANNPEIRVAMRRVAIARPSAQRRVVERPEFMYRGWGAPLAKPWDLRQTQHMFMFNQSHPGPEQAGTARSLLRREWNRSSGLGQKARCDSSSPQTFYDLLRNQDEPCSDEQAALALGRSARIKYVVGRSAAGRAKAQIALTEWSSTS
jgi:hypothetical protein